MKVSQTLRNLLNGVSSLPERLRHESYAASQTNILTTPQGNFTRPPMEHVALLADTPLTDFFHWIVLGDATVGMDVVAIGNDDLKVWRNDGTERTVYFPSGKAYLDNTDGAGFKAHTVGDYTFITNRNVTVERGSTKADAQVFEALIFIRQADFGTRYSVTINGVTVNSTTAAGSKPEARVLIGTDAIAEALIEALEDSQLSSTFVFTQYGSTIHVAHVDGSDFTISGFDGLADEGMKIIKGSVQAIADLPSKAPSGMVLKVVGDAGSAADDFYVKYEDSETGTQAGVWRETVAPGTLLGLDNETMPWALVRNGSLIGDAAQSEAPKAPEIVQGVGTATAYGWVKDADSATTYDGTTDLTLTTHSQGYQSEAIGNGDGTDRFKYVFGYDVDTSVMNAGDRIVLTWTVSQLGTFADEVTVGTKTYQGGQVLFNETFSPGNDSELAATAKFRCRLTYLTKASPTAGKRATVTLHRSDHPILPGITNASFSATTVTFDAAQKYPAGYQVDLTVGVTAFAYMVPAGSDGTGATVATALKNLIDAHVTYAATNPSAGVIVITGSSDVIPVAHNVSPFDGAWDSSLSMTDDEHVGRTLKNLTDGSSGTITANGLTTVEVTLAGGVNNTFSPGDEFVIVEAGDYYVFNTVPYADRQAGDMETCPLPSFVDLAIDDVFFYANRLGFVTGERIVLSASSDFFRFTRKTATQLLADDPIDLQSAHADNATLDTGVEWGKSYYFFSSSGHQFRLSGNPVVTPTTVQLKHAGSIPCTNVKPIVVGDRLVFLSAITDGTPNWTRVHELSQPRDPDVLDTPSDLTLVLPKKITSVATMITGEAGFLAVKAGSLWVYSYTQEPNQERAHKAWSEWTFGVTLLSIKMQGGTLWLVTQGGDGKMYLSSINVKNPPTAVDYVDQVGNSSTSTYTASYQLSKIAIRDQNGMPTQSDRLQLLYVWLHWIALGTIKVTVTDLETNTTISTKTYDPGATYSSADAEGVIKVPVMHRADQTKIVISNDAGSDPVPMGFDSLEWEAEASSRTRRL